MSLKAEDSHQEHEVANGGARGHGGKKKRGCARHCARFWWIYLIVFICIVILVVCLVIFVGIPRIAQQKLDAAELTVDGISVTNTQSDKYTMSINSTIRSDGKIHATIDAFEGRMYLEDLEGHEPFVTIDFPETTASASQVVNVTKDVEISTMGAFTTFNTWLLSNETLRVTLVGDTRVQVSGISRWFDVTFRKTIELKGLNGFKGMEVTQSNITLTPDENGDNFRGLVNIPNPSVLTIEIGNTSFHNYLLDAEIGTVFVDNLILVPGINNASMRANISQIPVVSAMQRRPYCETGVLPFGLRGKDVVNNGQRIGYFADALASHNTTIDIQIGEPLAAAFGGQSLTCRG